MKKSVFYYDTIFLYASLQSVGHTMEYFARHTKKLVVYIIMPRVNGGTNALRVYDRGILTHEHSVGSSTNIFFYYFLWWYHHNLFLLQYFSRLEHVLVFGGHPVAFIGMSVMKLLRSVEYAYWIGDYFPPVHWSLILFEKLKKYYHDRVSYTYYLSDRINKIFNGKVVRLANKKTVMWGVKPYTGSKKQITSSFKLLFVGAIRPSQGIEDLLLFIKNTPKVELSIIGVCEKNLFEKYNSLLIKYKISDRVWFPNRFVDDDELKKIAKVHHVGIALYEKGEYTATHYTDPGKVKTYIEMGLPVIMTNTSAIAPYIKHYMAGELIDEVAEFAVALKRIKRRCGAYQKGVHAFAQCFEYEKYYSQALAVLEKAG
ncbi:MAG: hypothetical protein AAB492_00670 [Patescibacteria group bacterium]